jgi:hypothetical protein
MFNISLARRLGMAAAFSALVAAMALFVLD